MKPLTKTLTPTADGNISRKRGIRDEITQCGNEIHVIEGLRRRITQFLEIEVKDVIAISPWQEGRSEKVTSSD
ncbi:hypothetical protein Asppvi_003616 [Aspergillus pseudoviridinutans]|uniref:Uncharacterized protein n=1 Tax=Aspergillus pseudoviridinutans TaxID=1517512 RepID=A0A9P3B8P1_9EURO|nr:uncharacterized protein Asppvi_003616 [Aspergillus pseudoviridinutans]GIJ84765.1 hypothetical protein Asppvi_003616 [Aspergillus pseudoviridinutans]